MKKIISCFFFSIITLITYANEGDKIMAGFDNLITGFIIIGIIAVLVIIIIIRFLYKSYKQKTPKNSKES